MVRRAKLIVGTLALCALLEPSAAVAAPTSDSQLALQFRPRLLFDAKERWRPVDVDAFLAEPGHAVCPPAVSAACTPLTSLAQLTPAIDHLDLRGTRGDGTDATAPDIATCAKSDPRLLDCDEDGRSVIYAHVVHKGQRIAIDYWWFLRYNAFTLDRHEGDWEGVTVVVDAAGTQLLDVHFAAHTDVWRYDAGVPVIVGNRVKVFLAHGTHAAYPRPCTRLCQETRTHDTVAALPEGHFGGARSWVGNSAAGCRRRCVKLFPASADGAPASWNAWRGRWGIPGAPIFPPPLTPAFQARFQNPFTAKHSGRRHFQFD